MRRIINYVVILAIVLFSSQGCTKKLDLLPSNTKLADSAFTTPQGYKENFAKLYASMAINSDIPEQIVSDGGNRGFLRMLWYLQALPTDEAVWNYSNNTDPIGMHQMQWSSSTQVIAGLYYRCLFNITLCNNFLVESTDEKLTQRNITGSNAADIRGYRNEARFLRAYLFSILLDEFGNVPFAQESSIVTGKPPTQIGRVDLFKYIESELKDLGNSLPDANVYGRANKAASWALLSRIYLNAEVYTGTTNTQYYTNAITYSKKVISAGYSLHPNYKELMLADNNLNTDEFIWTINYDGTYTQTYSGTTFLAHAPSIGGSNASDAAKTLFSDSVGVGSSWNCIRITEDFVDKFNVKDIRGQFWTLGMSKSVDTLLGAPANGYSSNKFRNVTRSGQVGPHTQSSKIFVDIDFPVFRLAEVYLNYAEAVLRGGSGGDNATALGYLKLLAVRARQGDPNAASSAQLDLQYIIDERGRELFWECLRRTDLIRFKQFSTGAYLWDWKGGVRNGTAVDTKYNLYPIPATDLSANPNLTQNTGY